MDGQAPPRPASARAAFSQFPTLSTAASTTPIPLVCRFLPHDQWFLTHLPPYYKGKDIKHHILAKCLNLTYTPPPPPVQFMPHDPSNGNPRPPSPITFAPDPRARASSPILFANVIRKNPLLSSDDDSDDWDDTMSATKSISDAEGFSDVPMPKDKGKARRLDSPDENSCDESLPPQGGRVLPMKPASMPSPPSQPPHTKPQKPKERSVRIEEQDPKAVPKVAHLSFSLIRFSTGQVFEDEQKLSEASVYHHEIFELHVSFVPLGKNPSKEAVLPPSANFPFALLNPSDRELNAKSKRKREQLKKMVAKHTIRLVRLPRSSPPAYVLPYWEGWVRILRWVSREATEYTYAGNMTPGVPPPGSSSKQGQWIGPGPAQYGGTIHRSWGADSIHAVGEIRENNLDANLALNFGLVGKPKDSRPREKGGQDSQNRDVSGIDGRTPSHLESRFEWRERWLVVRDGWVFLLRNRTDSEPTHTFPLSYLFVLRDADGLTESIDNAQGMGARKRPRPQPSSSRSQPMSPGAREKAPQRSAARGPRSPSPNSTLKGAPISSSSLPQSGYGHGKQRLGKHASKPSLGPSHDADPYDEDDEADHKPQTRSPGKKRVLTPDERHHINKYHSKASTSQEPSTPKPDPHRRSRTRDLSDPAVRSKLDMDIFIPNSKEEADLVGMKVIAAKFVIPDEEAIYVPGPFDQHPTEFERSSKNKRYTSTGPTLEDLVVSVPVPAPSSGLMGMIGVEENEDSKDGSKVKGGSQNFKASDHPGSRHKSRLSTKGSAPSSLTTDFGPNGKGHSLTADRRPSLPSLGGGSEAWKSSSTLTPSGSVLTHQNPSSSALSFSFFKGKDKEERKREKEEKEMRKAAKRRAEQERKEMEMDAPDATNSNSSWKISSFGKRLNSKHSKENHASLSTNGSVDEEHLVISRYEEKVNSAPRRDYTATALDSSRVEAQVRSARSSISSGPDEPDPSPIVFKQRGAMSDDDPPDSTISARPSFRDPFVTRSSGPASPTLARDPSSIATGNCPDDTADDDSDRGSVAISLSSPVFARDGGSDEDDEDSELEVEMGIRRRRTGYRFGANHENTGPEANAKGPAHDRNLSLDAPSTTTIAASTAESSQRTITGDHESRADDSKNTKAKQHTARFDPKLLSEQQKSARKGEWIIMDLGPNDQAYHSLLRILHRHTEELVSSTFMPGLRTVRRPVPSPRAPDRGPLLSEVPPTPPPKDTPPEKQLPPSPNRDNTLRSPTSSLRNRSQSDAAFMPQTRLPRTGPYSDDENDGRSPRHSPIPQRRLGQPYPSRLASASSAREGDFLSSSMPSGLGPFPYPEWRLQAVHRAKRAGLGQVNRPLEIMQMAMNAAHADYYDHGDPVFPLQPCPFSGATSNSGEDEDEDGVTSGEGKVEDEGEVSYQETEYDDEEEEEVDIPMVFTSESEDSDTSELEWQAWSADLPRQLRARLRRGPDHLLWRNPTRPLTPEASVGEEDLDDDDSDGAAPETLEGEAPAVIKQRRLREPVGVVTSIYTSTALPGFVATDLDHHDNEGHRQYHRTQRYHAAAQSVATLSSPSSSESLAVRQQQHAAVPSTSVSSSVASSPQSPQAHSRGHSQSISQTLPSARRGSLLHHSSSMQTNLRKPSDASQHDAAMRKASMPIMGSNTTTTTMTVTEQSFTLNTNSFGMAIQELKGQDTVSINSQPQVTSPNLPTPSSYDSHRYDPSSDPFIQGNQVSQHRAPSNVSLASGSQNPLRHQSSSFSMGRTSLSPSKGNVLKKKPSDVDQGRSPQASGSLSPKASPRPKLTVATAPPPPTSGSHASIDSLGGQLSPRSPRSPVATAGGTGGRSVGRRIIRHVKSGSSLKAGAEEGAGTSEGKAKKKKSKSGAFGMFSAAFP